MKLARIIFKNVMKLNIVKKTFVIIAAYYKETDPMKRLKLLNKSVEKGEDPEGNAIRKEIWEIRYAEKSARGSARKARQQQTRSGSVGFCFSWCWL